MAVYEAAAEAIQRARRGEGPTLIECVTYRNYGHFEGDAQTYKSGGEKERTSSGKRCYRSFLKTIRFRNK